VTPFNSKCSSFSPPLAVGDHLGISVAPLSDINNDGTLDVFIGANDVDYSSPTSMTDAGCVAT
jgi:hypothetical protein